VISIKINLEKSKTFKVKQPSKHISLDHDEF